MYEDGTYLSGEEYLHNDGSRLILFQPRGPLFMARAVLITIGFQRGVVQARQAVLFFDWYAPDPLATRVVDVDFGPFVEVRGPMREAYFERRRPLHRTELFSVDIRVDGEPFSFAVLDESGHCRENVEYVRVNNRVGDHWEPASHELLLEPVTSRAPRCFIHVLGSLCPPGRALNRLTGRCGERSPS